MREGKFLEVLRGSSLLIDQINDKKIEDINLIYDENAFIEVNGSTRFSGVSLIEAFWSALVASIRNKLSYQDVKIEHHDENDLLLTVHLSGGEKGYVGIKMMQSWSNTSLGWRIVEHMIDVYSKVDKAADNFLNFVANWGNHMQGHLSGLGDKENDWDALSGAWPDKSQIVFSDGNKLSGLEFKERLFGLSARFPDIVFDISGINVVSMTESQCIVHFEEAMYLANQHNWRETSNVMAFLENSPSGWQFRHVQHANAPVSSAFFA